MKKMILLTTAILISAAAITLKAHAQNASIKPYGNLYLFLAPYFNRTYNAGDEKQNDFDLIYEIDENSNLGFNFEFQKYKGVFELGLDDVDSKNKVRVRKAYGEYDLGPGKLKVGQDWCPYVAFSHESANYYRSKGFGSVYEDTNIQILVSYSNFYIDIIKPYAASREMTDKQAVNLPTGSAMAVQAFEEIKYNREITTGLELGNIRSFLPKTALGYKNKLSIVDFNVGAAFNAYLIDLEDDSQLKFNKDWIYSWLVFLNGSIALGKLEFNFSGAFIINPANFGIAVQSNGNDTYTGGAAVAIQDAETGTWEIKDTINMQAFAEVGYTLSSSINIYAGYGFSYTNYAIPNSEIDYAMEYYINCKINIGNLIALTPSVSYRDSMKDMGGANEGFDLYGGILATVSYY